MSGQSGNRETRLRNVVPFASFLEKLDGLENDNIYLVPLNDGLTVNEISGNAMRYLHNDNFAMLLLFLFLSPLAIAHPGDHQSEPVSETGRQFLNELDDDQREQAMHTFDHSARTDWSYFPGSRAGISLADLKKHQLQGVHQILQSGLSEKGYAKVNNILHIEDILGRMEDNPGYDAEKYFTAYFGKPNENKPWALRFEGHHLSLNYTFVNGKVASVTPAFFGANPAVVPEGPYTGKETLVYEQKLARRLVRSLDKSVREKAIFQSNAPREIVTEQEEKVKLGTYKGIPMADMGDPNRSMLKELIRVYTGNFRRERAEKLTSAFLDSGAEKIYFGWAGGTKPGEPHYYRIHAPGILIEYDNVQDGVNHIHSVIRSFDGDFGRDVIAEHYKNSPHHKED